MQALHTLLYADSDLHVLVCEGVCVCSGFIFAVRLKHLLTTHYPSFVRCFGLNE